MALTSEKRDFILGSEGFSRREIISIANTIGLKITERDVQTARLGTTPEKHAAKQQAFKPETLNIRESFKKNAQAKGLDSKIRGNDTYKQFKKQLQKVDKLLGKLDKGGISRKQYVQKRLTVYLGAGLISQAEYDAYLEDIDDNSNEIEEEPD
jgi:hypothetical protein